MAVSPMSWRPWVLKPPWTPSAALKYRLPTLQTKGCRTEPHFNGLLEAIREGKGRANRYDNGARNGARQVKRETELNEVVAEGVGFEPTIPVSQDKRLAGARTRPLCDPSGIWDINIADWGFGDNLGVGARAIAS